MREKIVENLAAFGIGILFIFAWMYISPIQALYNINKAAEKNDVADLSRFLDLPAITDSIKAQMHAHQEKAQTIDSPLAEFGSAFMTGLMDMMVDVVITPQSIVQILRGQKPDFMLQPGEAPVFSEAETEVTDGYENINTYTVTVSKKGDQSPVPTLLLERRGLTEWKIVALRLPPQQEVKNTLNLSAYVGKYPVEMLQDPVVNNRLKKVLGRQYDSFVRSIATATPIKVENDFYIGSGCAPQMCGDYEAAFVIDSHNGDTMALLYNNHTLHPFGKIHRQDPMPTFIAWYNDHRY